MTELGRAGRAASVNEDGCKHYIVFALGLALGTAAQGCQDQSSTEPICTSKPTFDPAVVAPDPPADHAVVHVAVGWSSSCAVIRDGTVWCWGSDGEGQLGWDIPLSNNDPCRSVPTRVHGVSDASKVAVSRSQGCAILRNGTVKCWGARPAAKAKGGITGRRRVLATTMPGLKNVVQLSFGFEVDCARVANGAVWCWLGAAGSKQKPVRASDLNDVAELRLAPDWGKESVCIRSIDGHVRCGRLNKNGVAYGHPFTDLKNLDGVKSATSLSIRNGQGCAIVAGGTLRCWKLPIEVGSKSYSPKVGKSWMESPIEQVSFLRWRVCLRSSAGMMTCDVTGTKPSVELVDVRQLATASRHGCAVDSQGVVRCWGSNLAGQLGDRSRLARDRPVPVLW